MFHQCVGHCFQLVNKRDEGYQRGVPFTLCVHNEQRACAIHFMLMPALPAANKPFSSYGLS